MFSEACIISAIVAEYLGADLVQVRAELNTPWLIAVVAAWKSGAKRLPWGLGDDPTSVHNVLDIEAGGFLSVNQEYKRITYPSVTFEPKAHDGETVIGDYTGHFIDLLLSRGTFDEKGAYVGSEIRDICGRLINPAAIWDHILFHPTIFTRTHISAVRRRVAAILGEFM